MVNKLILISYSTKVIQKEGYELYYSQIYRSRMLVQVDLMYKGSFLYCTFHHHHSNFQLYESIDGFR
jgi:hypothetical protein